MPELERSDPPARRDAISLIREFDELAGNRAQQLHALLVLLRRPRALDEGPAEEPAQANPQ
jgi:hypothetical protein